MLDAVYLQLHLPSSISISSVVYGTPRVGNNAFADHVDAHIHNLIRINNKYVYISSLLRGSLMLTDIICQRRPRP